VFILVAPIEADTISVTRRKTLEKSHKKSPWILISQQNFRQYGRSTRLSTGRAGLPAGPASMATEWSDAQLVRRVQKGEKGAFDLLVLKYQHKIVNLVMRYVRDPDQALDITQEAFLKAYRALPRFRGDSAFYTWLYRIAVNTAKNYLAAQRRRPMDVELDMQDPEQFDLHAKLRETDTPEGVTLGRELHEAVEKAIAALPDDLRTAIVLRELDGMSYEEIAQTMECPVGTVRSRIFRARDAIGKKIGNLLD
jgi:RNA polymerase sigma-70 factor (ECF subfamily)